MVGCQNLLKHVGTLKKFLKPFRSQIFIIQLWLADTFNCGWFNYTFNYTLNYDW